METLLCFVATVSAFEYKIRWRKLVIISTLIAVMVVFITPVFLYVRSAFRGKLSWTQRIDATIDAFYNSTDAFSAFVKERNLSARYGWYLNYYGKPQNVLERMSNINHVDVLKTGTDFHGKVGVKDLTDSIYRSMPRVLAPDKPRGYSKGDWLYYHFRARNIREGYATVALIGNGYSAFGWTGAFFYPGVLGLIWLVLVKKISGFDLHANIWAIYLLLVSIISLWKGRPTPIYFIYSGAFPRILFSYGYSKS